VAAAVLNSHVFNDFLCSQFSAFPAFSAFSSWQRRSQRLATAAFADGADGLVEELSPSQLDLALAATDDTGFDAHLAEALGEAEKQRRMTSKASFRRACEGERKLACFFPSRAAHLN
jgi:hypothetical protein